MSEPTPLSADKRYPIEIIQGVEGFCIGVNNYRLVGPKPWGGGTVVKRWNVSLADLGRAIPELSATIDAQATEIAALKGALEKTAEFLNGLAKADALPIGIADIQQEGARLDAIVLRVLAGKEAQR